MSASLLVEDDLYRIPDSPVSLILAVISVIIFIAGTIGNTVILIVLRQWINQANNSSSQFFETLSLVQAIADYSSVITIMIWSICCQGYNFDFTIYFQSLCKCFNGLFVFSYGVSTTIISIVSTARYIIVYKPFLYAEVASTRNAIFIVIFVIIMCSWGFFNYVAIFSVHKIIVNGTVVQFCGAKPGSGMGSLPALFSGISYVMIPGIVIIVIMILGYFQRKSVIGHGGHDHHCKKILTALNNNCIASVNLFVNVPLTVTYFLAPHLNIKVQNMMATMDIMFILGILPKACNVIILYCTSPLFRRQFLNYSHSVDIFCGMKLNISKTSSATKRGSSKPFQESQRSEEISSSQLKSFESTEKFESLVYDTIASED